MLYFFLGEDEPAYNIDHQVLLYTGDEPLACVDPPAEYACESYTHLKPHTLEAVFAPDLPHWSTRDYDTLVALLGEQAQENYESWVRELHQQPDKVLVARLFGHASGVGQDSREDAYVVREVGPQYLFDLKKWAELNMIHALDWLHFLTFESVDELDLMFWDAGYLQFLIHRKDPRNLNFQNLYAAIETS
ncbi:hypothetical protein DC3_24270 [Deinococcus cellulosilyticus NBRC 106333 = KACC 11606]|uniref:DUF1963 domain-containing protein n=2 Tax=Deinococcus cellulosilyticus TaxID=401558 RepID=A0A511N1Q3_DEIC1|nr:hypothetical protein DC3_24270 [Deinococcus cellulosilyticus NBRC 106333 = KACC 11606]